MNRDILDWTIFSCIIAILLLAAFALVVFVT